jgi:hypothetical protein
MSADILSAMLVGPDASLPRFRAGQQSPLLNEQLVDRLDLRRGHMDAGEDRVIADAAVKVAHASTERVAGSVQFPARTAGIGAPGYVCELVAGTGLEPVTSWL